MDNCERYKTQLSALSQTARTEIETAYYQALYDENDYKGAGGSHWILMGVLNQHGIKTTSTITAMEIGECLTLLM